MVVVYLIVPKGTESESENNLTEMLEGVKKREKSGYNKWAR